MLVRTTDLLEELSKECSDPAAGLKELVDERRIIAMGCDLYETDPLTPAYLDANALHEPSYISFEYALSWHGMLPGDYMVVTSATTGQKEDVSFSNPLGLYRYTAVHPDAFAVGVETLIKDGREFRIATPEKAVCDELSLMPPVGSLDGVIDLMFVKLGFDEDLILGMDMDLIADLAGRYHSMTIRTMARFLGATE